MLYVPVPQVILNKPRVRALVGQGEAASVAKHMRMGGQGQPGPLSILADRSPSPLTAKGRAALAYKKSVCIELYFRTDREPCLDKFDFIRA